MSWGDDATRFLQRVLPWPASDNDIGYGNLHWTSINTTKPGEHPYWVGKPFRDAEAMVSFAGWLLTRPNSRDLYFCTSLQAQSAKSRQGKPKALRSIQNTLFSKVLFLDIDVKDPPKGYANKDEALQALKGLLIQFKMPFPNAIVHSGGGLHVYWVDEPLALAEWQPRAEQLKFAAIQAGLRFDPQCTVDIARILRIPETLNWKTNPPKQVKLLHLD